MTRSPACVISEAGRRESNQDRACAEVTTVRGKPAVLLALADGMGGMNAGDRAAEIAIDTVREYATGVVPSLPDRPSVLSAALTKLFADANRRIWERSRQDGCPGEMGSTLVCCLLFDGRFLVASAGDSRCYYLNDHEVRLLTEDHSQVQDMVRRGVMTPEAARHSPYRNQLTNCLGEPHEIRVDLFPAPDKCGVIDEPCVLLLSSDGLHGHVDDRDLLLRIRSTTHVAEACSDLVSLALRRGSTDNVTVVAVEQGTLRRDAARDEPVPLPRGPITVKLRALPAAPLRRRTAWKAAAWAAAVLAALGLGYLGLPSLRALQARSAAAVRERFVSGPVRLPPLPAPPPAVGAPPLPIPAAPASLVVPPARPAAVPARQGTRPRNPRRR